ncbi:MAG: glutamate 5-kinase [Oscillospiraceae bacterium]|jgi:glutamate 5-kinase|nr:glutamate 5-kinase [Oscillospiraceae bacterium]
MKKKRIVFKVGTSTLCHGGKGLNFRNIENLSRALADVKNAGNDVVLVSSGAIGAGVGRLNLPERPTELRMKQAVASVGQCELIHIYDKFFGEYGASVGQILLTKDDVESPKARQNLLATFEALISLGVIPVVNENDAVAFEEIETGHQHVLGDNDTLSAIVASLLAADMLVILSDIDGLFDGDPRREPGARLIPEVTEIDARIEALAGGVGSKFGTGGMVTKILAARIATEAGVDTIITNGADARNIYSAAAGESVGTLFRGRR